MGLLTGRPAVVEEVLHESVVTGFNCLGSSTDYGVVGCVVASVSREPFQETEVSPKVNEFSTRAVLFEYARQPFVCGVVLSPSRFVFLPLFRSLDRNPFMKGEVVVTSSTVIYMRCFFIALVDKDTWREKT